MKAKDKGMSKLAFESIHEPTKHEVNRRQVMIVVEAQVWIVTNESKWVLDKKNVIQGWMNHN